MNKYIKTALALSAFVLSICPSTSAPADSRKIAILAWGSLIHDPRQLSITEGFTKSTFTFPIELARLSGEGTQEQRVTRIIDQYCGNQIPIWYTTSQQTFLPHARENLREREGTSKDAIFYIKTMLPNRSPDSTERPILLSEQLLNDTNGYPWYAYDKVFAQLPSYKIIELAQWATANNYSAVLWTGLGPKSGYTTLAQLIGLIKRDKRTLDNTKAYITNIPGEKTQFEQGIVNDTFS